jgi:hypothetical protein
LLSDGGDHSLELTKTALKQSGISQDSVEVAVIRRIESSLEKVA